MAFSCSSLSDTPLTSLGSTEASVMARLKKITLNQASPICSATACFLEISGPRMETKAIIATRPLTRCGGAREPQAACAGAGGGASAERGRGWSGWSAGWVMVVVGRGASGGWGGWGFKHKRGQHGRMCGAGASTG